VHRFERQAARGEQQRGDHGLVRAEPQLPGRRTAQVLRRPQRQGVEAGQQMRGQQNGADQGGCQPRQPWQVRLGQ